MVVRAGPGGERIQAFAAQIGAALPSGAADLLDAFGDLLSSRAVPLGLMSASDRDRVLERHVLDCLRAAAVFRSEDHTAWDLGSGAGLPGIVLACALPERSFHLVESRERAVAFLELAVERLALTNVEVLPSRVEEVMAQADVATARAFAPLEGSWAAAWPLLKPGGRLIYFAGTGLTGPAEAARALDEPEAPGEVHAEALVDSYGSLVIMSRRR
jgi:16S rRNA (guanine527-N7)-methyltransferase